MSAALIEEEDLDSNRNDGSLIADKLKSIRPFTETQLLGLYPINDLDGHDQAVRSFIQVIIQIYAVTLPLLMMIM